MRSPTCPPCPQCAKLLAPVKQDLPQMLNADQFDSIRAGDWFCDTCTGNRSKHGGYRYYWDREVETQK